MKRWTIFFIVVLLLSPLAFIQPVQSADSLVKSYVPPISRNELLRLVNEERAKVGVQPLVMDERLNASAQKKANEIVEENNYSHINLNGVHGYTYAESAVEGCMGGENINNNAIDAFATVQSWVNSPPHYKAMINEKLIITGFGIKNGYIVEHFCMLL